jgi:hypothetical protein
MTTPLTLPVSRSVLAQDIMDLYYRSFKTDQGFFDLEFFSRQVDYAYAKILRELYRQLRQELRADRAAAFDAITFEDRWLSQQTVELKKIPERGLWEAHLDKPVFSFPFDQSFTGYQSVTPERIGDCVLVRSSLERQNLTFRFRPASSVVFWWPEGVDTLLFTDACCPVVRVSYVAGLDDDTLIMESTAFEIQAAVLQALLGSKSGNVIDETNNSNANTVIEKEAETS